MAEVGDVVRHRTAGWTGPVTRHLGEGRLEVWEGESLAPYAMPHSVTPDQLDVVVPAPGTTEQTGP